MNLRDVSLWIIWICLVLSILFFCWAIHHGVIQMNEAQAQHIMCDKIFSEVKEEQVVWQVQMYGLNTLKDEGISNYWRVVLWKASEGPNKIFQQHVRKWHLPDVRGNRIETWRGK